MPGIPVPARLAHRPVQGGLVVPWIAVKLADGTYDLRACHRARVVESFSRGLCQVCGLPISGRVVFLVGDDQLPEMLFDTPPLDPVCASYARRACPMVAGQLTTYASRQSRASGPSGTACPETGCGCGGWHRVEDRDISGGPAPIWYEVWTHGYAVAVEPDGNLFGAKVPTSAILRIRPVVR